MRLRDFEKLLYVMGKLEGVATGCDGRVCQAITHAASIIDQITVAYRDKVLIQEEDDKEMTNGKKFVEVFGTSKNVRIIVVDEEGRATTEEWRDAPYERPKE